MAQEMRMKLAALRIQFGTVIAQAISTVSGSPFALRDILSWAASAIVVVDSTCWRFADFVDGIKLICDGHNRLPSCRIVVLADIL